MFSCFLPSLSYPQIVQHANPSHAIFLFSSLIVQDVTRLEDGFVRVIAVGVLVEGTNSHTQIVMVTETVDGEKAYGDMKNELKELIHIVSTL